MSAECIFCKIVRGEIPCANVYETDQVLAFLDIAPVQPGHALVIPKAHHPTLFDIPQGLSQELVEATQKVGQAMMRVTCATGLNLMMNNFTSAGQLVPHAHFHLIPRFEEDGLMLWPQSPYDDNEHMTKLAAAIKDNIA